MPSTAVIGPAGPAESALAKKAFAIESHKDVKKPTSKRIGSNLATPCQYHDTPTNRTINDVRPDVLNDTVYDSNPY